VQTLNKGWSNFMDRRVKERLVGATILVVLIVLVVPELLSGPARGPMAPVRSASSSTEAIRNVTVDLATKKATPEQQAAAAVPAPLSEPVSGAPASTEASSGAGDPAGSDHPNTDEAVDSPAGPPETRPAAPPTITTLKAQQAEPPALEKEPPPSKSPLMGTRPSAAREARPAETRHGWAVQLGSFSSRANADKLMRQLKARDSAYLAPIGKGASLRYRVRVGPLADRGAAERMIVKLKKEGHPASVVAP